MFIRTNTVAAYLGGLVILACAALPAWAHKPASTIPAAALIQPADFAAALQSRAPQAAHPAGRLSQGLRAGAHPRFRVRGSGRRRGGLAPLQARVAKLPTDSAIVIYCGCCPWRKCRTSPRPTTRCCPRLQERPRSSTSPMISGPTGSTRATRRPRIMTAMPRALAACVLGLLLAGAASAWNRATPRRTSRSRISPANRCRLADYRRQARAAELLGQLVRAVSRGNAAPLGWQRTYAAAGLQIIGISMDDSSAPAKRLLAKRPVDYPVALGDAKLARATAACWACRRPS